MTFQTSYTTTNPVGLGGMLADYSEPHNRDTGICSAAVGVGLGVIKHATSRMVSPISDITASATSIVATGGASAASVQNLATTSLNGAIGQLRIVPAQQVSLVLSSSADWDATTATISGEDADGNSISEDIAIPDAGAVTVKTKAAFGRVVNVRIPAQSGTGGTFTVGTSPDQAEYSRADFRGVAEWQAAHMPYDTTTYTNGEYPSGEDLPVLTKGRVWVYTEAAALRGDRLYVRIVASGSDKGGQFSSARSASFALVRGSHFITAQATAGGLATVQL